MNQKKSSEILRWEMTFGHLAGKQMTIEADGAFVRYEDHAAHVARLEEKLAEAQGAVRNAEAFFLLNNLVLASAHLTNVGTETTLWAAWQNANRFLMSPALARPQESEKNADPNCEFCEGSGYVEEHESFQNAYGEHGLKRWDCTCEKPPPAKSEFDES